MKYVEDKSNIIYTYNIIYKFMRNYNKENLFNYIDMTRICVRDKKSDIELFSINFPKIIDDLSLLSYDEFNAYIYLKVRKKKKSIGYKVQKLIYKINTKGKGL